MIEYIRGTLEELTPALAVVDCGGVGYGLNISLGTFSALQGRKEVKRLAVEVIREDSYTLWGFATRSERELFLQLTSVSGIGAGMARMILSAFSPAELAEIISSGNHRANALVRGCPCNHLIYTVFRYDGCCKSKVCTDIIKRITFVI